MVRAHHFVTTERMTWREARARCVTATRNDPLVARHANDALHDTPNDTWHSEHHQLAEMAPVCARALYVRRG